MQCMQAHAIRNVHVPAHSQVHTHACLRVAVKCSSTRACLQIALLQPLIINQNSSTRVRTTVYKLVVY